MIIGADRLRGVFDYRKMVAARDFKNGIHLDALSEEVNRHDRAGPRRNRALDELRINVEIRAANIDIDRARSQTCDRTASREECIRDGDHFVAGADVERHQREQQSVRTRCATDGVPAAAVGPGFTFEIGDLRAHDKLLTLEDAIDRGAGFFADRLILGL